MTGRQYSHDADNEGSNVPMINRKNPAVQETAAGTFVTDGQNYAWTASPPVTEVAEPVADLPDGGPYQPEDPMVDVKGEEPPASGVSDYLSAQVAQFAKAREEDGRTIVEDSVFELGSVLPAGAIFRNCTFRGPELRNEEYDMGSNVSDEEFDMAEVAKESIRAKTLETLGIDTVSQPVGTSRPFDLGAAVAADTETGGEGTLQLARLLQRLAEKYLTVEVGEAQLSMNFFRRSFFRIIDGDENAEYTVIVVRNENSVSDGMGNV